MGHIKHSIKSPVPGGMTGEKAYAIWSKQCNCCKPVSTTSLSHAPAVSRFKLNRTKDAELTGAAGHWPVVAPQAPAVEVSPLLIEIKPTAFELLHHQLQHCCSKIWLGEASWCRSWLSIGPFNLGKLLVFPGGRAKLHGMGPANEEGGTAALAVAAAIPGGERSCSAPQLAVLRSSHRLKQGVEHTISQRHSSIVLKPNNLLRA